MKLNIWFNCSCWNNITRIVIQLEACQAQLDKIDYINKNAYTGDVISTGTFKSNDKLHYYLISNNLMETELDKMI